jgi:hypothetical protein
MSQQESVEPIGVRLQLVDRHIARAVAAAEADAGASPVLRAVLSEFQGKAQKASGILSTSPAASASREAVVEVEQAGDSANVAAKADPGASEETRKAVDVAHMAMCLLKVEGHS